MQQRVIGERVRYAQIGALILANEVTKLLVPALYAIFVLDLNSCLI